MSRHKPINRIEFKNLLLRRLGAPVLQINVSEDQIEDAIEEALRMYEMYHYNGSEHVYYSHVVTQDDIDKRSFAIPDIIIGVTEIYSLNTTSYLSNASDMFSGGYQMAYDFAFNSSSGSMLSYYTQKVNYEFMNQMLIGQTPIRFNQQNNRVYVDFNWGRVNVGDRIVLDAYKRTLTDGTDDVHGEIHSDIWSDNWLIKYATAKLKYLWGSNLSKFEGVQMPGGGTINGSKIQDDAFNEIQAMEDELLVSWSIPVRDAVG